MEECIFCAIASGSQKADIVHSDEGCVAFRDIHPKAPVHILIIPKQHIASVADTSDANTELLGHLVRRAADIAAQQGIAQSGYKLVFNVGRGGGQVIDHVHLHILGGWNNGDAMLAV